MSFVSIYQTSEHQFSCAMIGYPNSEHPSCANHLSAFIIARDQWNQTLRLFFRTVKVAYNRKNKEKSCLSVLTATIFVSESAQQLTKHKKIYRAIKVLTTFSHTDKISFFLFS